MIFHGALIVDKSSNMTSHDVVDRVRRVFDQREVGHAGTLDPIATGLLICLLGEGTKLSQYVMSEEKSYRVGIKFGVQTDSGDITGKVISEKPAKIELDSLKNHIASLVGELDLPVPKYSAVKVKGKKLYEYARENEEIETPIKKMTIKSAQLIEATEAYALVDLDCEKGTYVRSWAEKLGELQGCGATVESLRRTRSGGFDLAQSKTIVELEKLKDPEVLSGVMIPFSEILALWPALKVTGRDESLIKNGQIPKGVFGQFISAGLKGQGVRILDEKNAMRALLVADPMKGVKIARVFNH